MQGLTQRQTEVLEWVRTFIGQNHYPPTRKEVADGMKFSSINAAHDHLVALDRKGAIRMAPGVARGIVILQPPATASAPDERGKWPFPSVSGSK